LYNQPKGSYSYKENGPQDEEYDGGYSKSQPKPSQNQYGKNKNPPPGKRKEYDAQEVEPMDSYQKEKEQKKLLSLYENAGGED
jgi:hypothetical protein